MTASSPLMALGTSSQSFGIRYHQLWRHYRDGTIQEIEAGWDGSEENAMPSTKAYYKVYAQELAATVEDNLSRPSDSETDVEDYKNDKRLIRQEKKAIEKELSYRDILSQSEDYIQEFIKSAHKEETSFMKFKSLKPVPPDVTEKILADPELKKRVITGRACYGDKNKDVPPLKAKTRIVARRNQDPDLRALTRQAPTPSRISEMLTYLIFLSGLHQRPSTPPQSGRCGQETFPQLSGKAVKI